MKNFLKGKNHVQNLFLRFVNVERLYKSRHIQHKEKERHSLKHCIGPFPHCSTGNPKITHYL
jgi:hypothetical protein